MSSTPKAETELDQLYDDIADPCVAGGRLGFRCRHPGPLPERVDFSTVRHRAGRDHAWSAGYRLPACPQHCFRSRCRTGLVLGIFSPAATSRRNCWKAGSEALLRLAWGSTLARRRFSGRWHAPAAVWRWELGRRVILSGTPLTISAKPAHEFPPRGYLHEKSKKHRR